MKGSMLVFLLLFSFALGAQTSDPVKQDPPIYNDVAGSVFLLKDWSDGVIRFSSGRVASQFKIKFDCLKNQLLLQFNGSSFSTESKVKEFVIYTKKGKDSMIFKKGFPSYAEANEETFYQVIYQDKITLLHLYVKNITEEQQLVSKVIYRRIRDEDRFFFLKDNMLILIPADRTLIPDLFPEHADSMRQFINEKQLKFRDNDDFLILARHYNELLTK